MNLAFVTFICFFTFGELAAVTVSPCIDNFLEIVEGKTDNKATCGGFGSQDTVTWNILISPNLVNIGTCIPSSPCSTPLSPAFIASRTSGTTSVMNINPTQLNSLASVKSGTLECKTGQSNADLQTASCHMDYVVPAVGSCSVQFGNSSSRWTVSGSCIVTNVYSARGRYKCKWYQQRETAPEEYLSVTDMTTQPISGSDHVSGQCSINSPLPRDNGTYSYIVKIVPGYTRLVATFTGNNKIEHPVPPRVTCSPRPYVRENSTVSCTCSTQSVGKPSGRLRWFKGNGNNVINSGNYGITKLNMTPQTLSRSDHGAVFRCGVDWNQTTILVQRHVVNVGYIDSPTLTVSPVVTENQSVTFTCQANGRPAPSVALANRYNGTELDSQSSPLSYNVSRARCEDAGVYTCTASNEIGRTTMDGVPLRVKCSPRAVVGQSGPKEHPSVNFKGEPVSLNFNMTAYPEPDSFNFTFLGPNMTTTITRPSPVGIALNAACQQHAAPLYLVACIVTVDNVTSTAAGFYRVTLTNDQGKGDFIFQVKVNADTMDDPTGQSGTDNTGAIVGGVVAVLLVTAVVVVVVVLVLRRRKDPVKRRKLDDEKELSSDRLADVKGAHGVAAESEEQDVSKDVYAVVNKPTKSPAVTSSGQSVAAKITSSPNGGSATQPHPPATKPKPKKSKTKKGNSGDKERTEHEYGNLTLSMAPAGNCVADTEKTGNEKTKKSAGGGAARKPNQDGLLYTMVDFSGQRQQPTKPATPPDQQGVVYSDVLFNPSITKQ